MKEARFPWGFLFVHRSVSLVHHRARLTSYPGARGEIYIYIYIYLVLLFSANFCHFLREVFTFLIGIGVSSAKSGCLGTLKRSEKRVLLSNLCRLSWRLVSRHLAVSRFYRR